MFEHDAIDHARELVCGTNRSENRRTAMTGTRTVTVVGGGLAGLVAAATAAHAGAEVLLLEARREVGGRARTDTVDGFRFNQGPHALYENSAGMSVLRDLGITPRGGQPSLRGYGRLRGKVGLLPGTPFDALRSRVVTTRTKVQLAKVLASPGRALKTDTHGRTMRQWIDEQVSDPDARMLLNMATRTATYLDDLSTIAADCAVPQTVGALTDGVLYLDDGWGQLVRALRSVAEAAGVKIDHDAKLVTIDGLDSDAVVIATGGPRHAATLIGDRSTVVRDWADAAQPVFASTLELGLERLPNPEIRFCPAVDGPLYLSVHTPSAALAPLGGEMVHVMRLGEPAGDPRADMESLMDDAQPGWRSLVRAERFNRQLVVAHDRPTLERGGLPGRPGPEIPDLPNVFVAGDWVGPDGLLGDAALASGRAAGVAAVAG
jgi:phytoene dehydrogenase-like protein